MTEILIVDDHAVVRRGIRDILEQEPDLRVCGEAASGAESLQLVQTRPWSLVILDLSLPDQNGLEVLRELKRMFPQLPVLVLSSYPEEEFAPYAVKYKAAGYLLKSSAADELLAAVRAVLAGGVAFSPAILAALVNESLTEGHMLALSQRERDVLRCIAQGMALSETAAALNLSVKTVSTYRSRLLQKLSLRTTSELFRYALKHDLGRLP